MTDIPLEQQIWTAEQCAEYMSLTKAHFLRQTRYATAFPKPLDNFPGRPRWSAKEVVYWALK